MKNIRYNKWYTNREERYREVQQFMKKRMIKLTGALLLVASLVFPGAGKARS